MAKRFYVTTSIPYVNARPHIGHALEFVQADVFARFQRSEGHEVFLLAGTDDNALKNVQAAEAAGKPVVEYVAEHTSFFRETLTRLAITPDYFIRTSSDERHRAGAQKLWESCRPEDVYKKKYRGLYCVGCEEFKTEKEISGGECPEHPGKKLEVVEEENYFFRLSAYQGRLEELITSNTLRVTPESRKNEMLSFIRSGLEDFSISRSVARARGWGVPVPGDESQVMYVWFDALANYITALEYGIGGQLFETWWRDDASHKVHFIGKGINRFHSIYWPAMLLSAGVPLPHEVVVHGYLTVGGVKMSKSVGNVIDPDDLVHAYGTDAVRYYLLRHVSPFEDSDFTIEKFKEAYNANLADGLGNLVSRVMKMAETHLPSPVVVQGITARPQYTESLQNYDFKNAIDLVWSDIAYVDKQIQEQEPFKLVREDREKGVKIIEGLVDQLGNIADKLRLFMPATSNKILAAIRENRKPENLFPRLPAMPAHAGQVGKE